MKNNKYSNLIITTTDTVLGLGGKINEEVKNNIYELKGRDRAKKLIILVASLKQARIVVNDQGFRMPNQKLLLDFLEKNGPMYMTSCNISNAPVCKTIEEAKEIFPEITNIYNFGNMSQKPSMIIRAEDKKILRS